MRGGENCGQKIGNICRTLKKRLKCGRDKLPIQVDRHQVAPPIWLGDLQLAVWTRLYTRCLKYGSFDTLPARDFSKYFHKSNKILMNIFIEIPLNLIESGSKFHRNVVTVFQKFLAT